MTYQQLTAMMLVGLDVIVASAFPSHAQAPSQDNTCQQDWRKCADNRQLVENYSRWNVIAGECQDAAYRFIAPYGTPNRNTRYDTARFFSFIVGDDYPKTGIAVATAPNFEYSDASGARRSAWLNCTYDMRKERVVDVKFGDR